MKRALEMRGYGPCYHMYEVTPDPVRYHTWLDIYDGESTPDWNALSKGFRATVDWPACTYWRVLAAAYPEAKILLTVRSAQSWYASMDKTILTFMRDPEANPGISQRLARRAFDNRLDELRSGWEPLCTFLDVPVRGALSPRQ